MWITPLLTFLHRAYSDEKEFIDLNNIGRNHSILNTINLNNKVGTGLNSFENKLELFLQKKFKNNFIIVVFLVNIIDVF